MFTKAHKICQQSASGANNEVRSLMVRRARQHSMLMSI